MGLILCLSVLSPFALTSAAQAPETPHARLTRSQNGVFLDIGNTRTGIEIWQDGIVRVTHHPINISPAFASLSVVAQPQRVDWKFQQVGHSAFLTTSRLVVRLDIDTGAVSFSDRGNTALLAERPQGTWLSASVAGNSAWVATTGAGSKSATEESGQRFELASDESIYGLGQHPDSTSMDYVGSSVQLLQENTRVAIPVLLSSKGYALFWDNPAITNVDVGKSDPHSVQWLSEAGSGVDYYFMAGPEPDRAISEYRWLTGNSPMFPLWAWGFWQSRERYKTQDEILGVAAEYRKRSIPFDGIIQDWQYWAPLNQDTATAGWGSHEFDPSRYPDPAEMIRTLHEEHVHFMAVCWAKFDVTKSGVSIPNLRELEAVDGAFSPAIPYVFPPGQGKWYDPFNDRARQVYSGQIMKKLFSLGVDAWWLDSPSPNSAAIGESSGTLKPHSDRGRWFITPIPWSTPAPSTRVSVLYRPTSGFSFSPDLPTPVSSVTLR